MEKRKSPGETEQEPVGLLGTEAFPFLLFICRKWSSASTTFSEFPKAGSIGNQGRERMLRQGGAVKKQSHRLGAGSWFCLNRNT